MTRFDIKRPPSPADPKKDPGSPMDPKEVQNQMLAPIADTLQNVPEDKRKFIAAMSNRGQRPRAFSMDVATKKLRPEERIELEKLGWDGKSAIPSDLADLLKDPNVQRDEIIHRMSMAKAEGELAEKDFSELSPEKKQMFMEASRELAKLKDKGPIVVDSRQFRSSSPESKEEEAKTRPAIESVIKGSPPTKVASDPDDKDGLEKMEAVAAAADNICNRCSWNNNQKYPVEPTQEDIDMRVASFASTMQGGDGRFRKTYKLFRGAVTVEFRELSSLESKRAWDKVQSHMMKTDDPQKEYVQSTFAIPNLMMMKMCCGLSKITINGKVTEIPTLADLDKQLGPKEDALDILEYTIRSTYLTTETMMMAVSREWMAFEDLVSKLWMNQDFYNGAGAHS